LGFWAAAPLEAVLFELERMGEVRIDSHVPFLKVAYYLGLDVYNDLLTQLYRQAWITHPWSLGFDTVIETLSSFGMSDQSYRFQPTLAEVEQGQVGPSFLGYVPFRWLEERHVCYHETAALRLGAKLFDLLVSTFPPTWLLWAFASVAFVSSMFHRDKGIAVRVVLGLGVVCISFVALSNVAWVFRLKELELIRPLLACLASLGIVQVVVLGRQGIRRVVGWWYGC
jgi:hypothetical protein